MKNLIHKITCIKHKHYFSYVYKNQNSEIRKMIVFNCIPKKVEYIFPRDCIFCLTPKSAQELTHFYVHNLEVFIGKS